MQLKKGKMARENCLYQDIYNYIVHGNYHPDATDDEKNELLKEAIQYTVIQGTLYRTYPSACKKLHLVLSKQTNQKNAIFESHICNDKHLGIKETCLNARKKYHWKNMDNDIIDFIKNCPDCNKNNDMSLDITTKPQQYEYLDRVWKLVEITIIGPLIYQKSKVYLLRLADVFSKWMCFHKLDDIDSKEISKILLKEFSIMGFPIGIRLVGLENNDEISNLFENEIKEFMDKTKEVNKIFTNNVTMNNKLNLHENDITQSPKNISECLPDEAPKDNFEESSNSPVLEELTNCSTEILNSNNNNVDVKSLEKIENESSDLKAEEMKPVEEEQKEINKESLTDLINTLPNGSEPSLEKQINNSVSKNETLICVIKESNEFLINKLNDFEVFIENQDDNDKPLIYIFIGEKSIIDKETGNVYKEKLEKFIEHFPDLWVEYLPNFIVNIQSSLTNSFQSPSQVMFHREPHLLGLFESSYLNRLINFPDTVENKLIKNNIANGSHKHSTSRRIKRYSLRQSPKPNESLGFFNDYIRTSPAKRTTRSFNKKDFPPFKSRKLASKEEVISALVEKYSLKDPFVVLQPLPSKVVESALAGNVKVANPVLGIEKQTPMEKSLESNSLSLPSSSKEANCEISEANKENNENHAQHEQEVAIR